MNKVLMATKSLKDLDHLQNSIRSIVEDALKQVDVLQSNLESSQLRCDNLTKENKELTDCVNALKTSDDEGLFIKYTQLLHEFGEYQRKVELLCCTQCREQLADSSNNGIDDQIRKELDDISSLELDSQFEPDSPCIVQETPSPSVLAQSKNPGKSNVARNLMDSIFGAHLGKLDVVLADDSPARIPVANNETLCHYVAETVPDSPFERTPVKSQVNEKKPVIYTTPVEKLMNAKKPRMVGNDISPSWQSLFSPVKSSPKKNSPNKHSRTPSKRLLQKTHRIKAENTAKGVKMFSQTQLTMNSFKKVQKSNPEDLVVSQISTPCTPLNSVENNIDLNATRLTSSAVKRLAEDNVAEKDDKEVFLSSYDRIPEEDHMETRKSCRNKLPGKECLDCKNFYNHFDNGDVGERHRLLDKFSRHRTKNVPISNTPEGYWKPMLSPSPKK